MVTEKVTVGATGTITGDAGTTATPDGGDVVIVAEGDGHFRPRLVKLGRRHLSVAVADGADGFAAGLERYHEVLSGLAPGDEVVVLEAGSDLGRALAAAGRASPDGRPGAVTLATDGLATATSFGFN